MTTLDRAADQAFSYTLTCQSGGVLVTPTVTPTASMFTDAARTLGEVALTVTATAQPQVFTVSGPATAAGRRYLKHLITTSLGVREDEDDEVLFSAVSGSVGDGSTVADILEEARAHLRLPEGLNLLAAAVDASQVVLPLTYDLGPIGAGTVLSIGLEECHVWSADLAAKTVTVRRGHGSSAPAAHDAGDLVRVPRSSDFAMLRQVNNEVRALSGAGLWQMRALELTTSTDGARTYDLADDVADVYDVLYDSDSTANTWPRVKSWAWRASQGTGDFASGSMLRIDSPVPHGRPLRVVYKAALTPGLSALTDDVETVTGLRASAHDLLALGAAWRLVAGAEVERNQTYRQGDSRRAEEVGPGAKLRSALGLQQVRQARLAEELRNQERLYPPLSR